MIKKISLLGRAPNYFLHPSWHTTGIVLFEYQTHSQFASALLGTGGRTKMDEFAQKAMFKGPKSVTSILGLEMSLTYTYRYNSIS